MLIILTQCAWQFPSGWQNDFPWQKSTDGTGNIVSSPSSSNVGIGTTGSVPNKLYVVGDIFATGTVTGASGSAGWTKTGTNVYLTTSTDNVGVGTSVPQSKLDITGSDASTNLASASAAMAIVNNTNTTNNNFGDFAFGMTTSTGAQKVFAKMAGVATTHTNGAEAGDIAFLTTTAGTGAERMRILAGGNVGIGTLTPGTLLELRSSSNNGIRFRNTNPNPWHLHPTGADLQFTEDNVSDGRLYLQAGGNIGIGTQSPKQLLEIQPPSNAIAILGINSTGNSGSQVLFGSSNSYSAGIEYATNVSGGMTFHTNGTNSAATKILLTSAGNVGIGTLAPAISAPVALLHVVQGAASDAFRVDDVDATDQSPFVITSAGNVGIGTAVISSSVPLEVVNANSTTNANTYLASFMHSTTGTPANGIAGGIQLGASRTTGGGAVVAAVGIQGIITNVSDNTANSGALAVLTRNNGTLTEAFRIQGDGNVGIGTIAPQFGLVSINNVGIGTWAPTTSGAGVLETMGAGAYASVGGSNIFRNSAVPLKSVYMGYDNTIDAGYIQGIHSGVITKPIILQGNGANVGIGSTNPGVLLDVGGSIRSTLGGSNGTNACWCTNPPKTLGYCTGVLGTCSACNYNGSGC